MSGSGTCGGNYSSIIMVFAVFNGAFIIVSPASNEIDLVEGGALRRAMISFATSFFNSSDFTAKKGYSWRMKVTVLQLHTWFVLGK